MHGNEFSNWATTEDGYTVVRDHKGAWVYATLENETLHASGHIAHDSMNRPDKEQAFLNGIAKGIIPKTAKADLKARPYKAPEHISGVQTDYEKFRGLIILAEFSDRKFSRADYAQIIDEMVNKPDYSGYMNDAMIPAKEVYTGSVRDYFFDNSMGKFDPHFDIVGPVTIDYSENYINQTAMAQQIVSAVCDAADPYVDFSIYDTNGDNKVEMFYIIFAGYGSNYDSSQRYVWPHASTLMGGRHDGVSLGRYACSTEFYGTPSNRTLDGIGTICHEFSHVLGLNDEYDTDYASSGGQSIHPGKWSLMASGSYLNKGRTPCGYSMYQRYLSGFAEPTTISGSGDYTLTDLNASNCGYRINSSIDNEFFIIENRQQTKWDEYLPGHGMLIHRVDRTNEKAWENNDLNVNPSHNYYELLRANPRISSNGSVTDSDGDPFPGSGGVTAVDNETTPSLKSWTGLLTDIGISDIAESEDGVISFKTNLSDFSLMHEDWEDLTFDADNSSHFTGKVTGWTLDNATVEAIDTVEAINGHCIALMRRGTLTSDIIHEDISQATFTMSNVSSSTAMIRFSYSIDGGSTWRDVKTSDGLTFHTLLAGETKYAAHVLEGLTDKTTGTRLRITEYTGSATEPCLIDDLHLKVIGSTSAIDHVVDTSAASLSYTIEGDSMHLYGVNAQQIQVYDMFGRLLHQAKPDNGQATIPLTGIHGMVIVKSGTDILKVAF